MPARTPRQRLVPENGGRGVAPLYELTPEGSSPLSRVITKSDIQGIR